MKILVPVDPSDSAHAAVTKAALMAKLDGSELTLLAVAETFEDMESLFGGEATERMKERASKALDAAKAQAAAAGIKPKTMLKAGISPEDLICDAAEKGGFDLVVMG
ncbi:MAG: universal stress protein, partial [Humidesulfovibrio sp.]|nr:universal stress protein [Humidesulfovibrio sp.]